MSEENRIQLVEQPEQPIFRKRRHRTRPVGDPNKVIEALQEQNATMQKQVEQLMTLVAQSAGKSNSDTATITFGQMLPRKPDPIPRPEGIIVELWLKNQDLTTGDRFSVFSRTLPARTDNPEIIDPRICVYCIQNVCEIYGSDISGAPTEAEMLEIKKLHKLHLDQMRTLKGSKELYKDARYKHKVMMGRLYADHFELNYRIVGRVPDEVAFLHDKGGSLTAEQEYKRRLGQWNNAVKSAAQKFSER